MTSPARKRGTLAELLRGARASLASVGLVESPASPVPAHHPGTGPGSLRGALSGTAKARFRMVLLRYFS